MTSLALVKTRAGGGSACQLARVGSHPEPPSADGGRPVGGAVGLFGLLPSLLPPLVLPALRLGEPGRALCGEPPPPPREGEEARRPARSAGLGSAVSTRSHLRRHALASSAEATQRLRKRRFWLPAMELRCSCAAARPGRHSARQRRGAALPSGSTSAFVTHSSMLSQATNRSGLTRRKRSHAARPDDERDGSI